MSRFLKVAPRLAVDDLSRTIAFYTEVLGFTIGLLWPEDSPSFALLELDEVCVQFSARSAAPGESAGGATLSFDVSDVRALHGALGSRVPVEWGPEVYWYGRREFAIKDPGGNLLIFSEQTDDPPTCRDEG